MKKEYIETTTKILDENKSVVDIKIIETIVITPDEGKQFLNKRTNELINATIGIGTEDSIDNYEEVDIPNTDGDNENAI